MLEILAVKNNENSDKEMKITNIQESEYEFFAVSRLIFEIDLFVLNRLLSKSACNRITINDSNDRENRKYDDVSRKFIDVGTAFSLLNLINNC